MAFVLLAGCGGGGTDVTVKPPSGSATASPTSSPSSGTSSTTSGATPTPTPSPSPTPIPLGATPANIAFGGVNGTQQLIVVDKGFTGTITAVTNDSTIATVSPASISVATTRAPASTGVFTITSIGIGTNLSGATTITISDGTLTIKIPVTVSVTNGSITYRAVFVRPRS